MNIYEELIKLYKNVSESKIISIRKQLLYTLNGNTYFNKNIQLPFFINADKIYVGDEFPLHRNYFFEILVIINGKADLFINNKKYKAEKNKIYLFSHKCNFELTNITEPIERIYIFFLPEIINSNYNVFGNDDILYYNILTKIFSIKESSFYITNKMEQNNFLRILHQIFFLLYIFYQTDNKNSKWILNNLFVNFLYLLADEISDKVFNITKKIKRNINDIINYINNNFQDSININKILAEMGYNRIYMDLVMKRITGSTISEYINQLRIKKSMELINSTDYSITRIAYESGFKEYSTFFRVFKKINNISPNEYKKKFGQL